VPVFIDRGASILVILHPFACRFGLEDQARFFKRQLSLPVSTMSQWWVSRSSKAAIILASPKLAQHTVPDYFPSLCVDAVEL